jgi:hypothetical protein
LHFIVHDPCKGKRRISGLHSTQNVELFSSHRLHKGAEQFLRQIVPFDSDA